MSERGERREQRSPGQRRGTAQPRPPAQPAGAEGQPGSSTGRKAPETGAKSRGRARRTEGPGPGRGTRPRGEEDSTERRARTRTQRTHPPTHPGPRQRERREGPAVRAARPQRPAAGTQAPTFAHAALWLADGRSGGGQGATGRCWRGGEGGPSGAPGWVSSAGAFSAGGGVLGKALWAMESARPHSCSYAARWTGQSWTMWSVAACMHPPRRQVMMRPGQGR
jgi:hypothetical protein